MGTGRTPPEGHGCQGTPRVAQVPHTWLHSWPAPCPTRSHITCGICLPAEFSPGRNSRNVTINSNSLGITVFDSRELPGKLDEQNPLHLPTAPAHLH